MQHKRAHARVAVGLCALAAVACASDMFGNAPRGARDENGAPFPSRAELVALASTAAPAIAVPANVVTLDAWTLAGPFADRLGSDDALACAAREIGRVILVHDRLPEPRLKSFLLGRCGSADADAGARWLSWNISGGARDVSDDELMARDRGLVRTLLTPRADDARVGAAMVRDGQRALLVVLEASGPLTLDAQSQRAAGGAFSFVGAFTGAITARLISVSAAVTRGRLAAASCARDDTVALPRFRFTCALDPGDDTAWVQVFALERDRLLARGVGAVLALQDDASADTVMSWTRVAYVAPAALPERDAGAALLALVNDLRARAGARPLADLAAQRAVAERVAPHYFAALASAKADDARSADARSADAPRADAPDQTVDLVCLGLMAGWDVREWTIGNGAFASMIAYGTDIGAHLDDVLGAVLDSPSARWALLDPKLAGAAVVVKPLGAGAVGVLVASYEPFVRARDGAMRATRDLAQLRTERGLSALEELPLGSLMDDAAHALAGGADPDAIARNTLTAAVKDTGRELHVWTLEVQDLDDIPWPKALLTSASTRTAIAVGSRKPKRAAWGSHCVLVVAYVGRT